MEARAARLRKRKMLVENTLFGERDKIKTAIERIKFAYEVAQQRELGDLYVCFSGGKDSTVLAELCKMAQEQYGVEYSLNYNVTGIDPPELVYFMRQHYPELIWHPYKKSMWQLIIEKHMPPTRLVRYCCAELKERGGENKMCLTGVRWAESVKRKNNRTAYEVFGKTKEQRMLFSDNDDGRLGFENCMMKRKLVCNPIVDWENDEVWEFIHKYDLPYCSLYDEGFSRLGCIGCPISGTIGQKNEFARYPKFKKLYLLAFDKTLKGISDQSKMNWKTAEDVMNWWLSDKAEKPIEGQITMEEL